MIIKTDFELCSFTKCNRERVFVPVDDTPKHVFDVGDESQLLYVIHKIYDTLSKCEVFNSPQMWYRGHKNAEQYVLLPLIIRRHYAEQSDNISRQPNYSLAEYQRSLMESFAFRSINTRELVSSSFQRNYSEIELLAQMQHYGVATNLLDWTENLFAALYFACEDCFINKNGPQSNATVYAFEPYLYNGIRSAIIRDSESGKHFGLPAHRRNLNSASYLGNVVPNFSIQHNIETDSYLDFIRGDEFCTTSYQRASVRKVAYSNRGPDQPPPLLPLAVQIPRTSARIQQQEGTFLAFNLSDSPSKAESKYMGFKHVELEQIQEYYLYEFAQDVEIRGVKLSRKVPFLYRLNIRQSCLDSFKRFILSIGMRTYKLYPELYKIGEEIMNTGVF